MPQKRGLSLVELLVVIAIIGLMVALLLPAINAARESARRTQCVSNFKQVALGVLNYTSSQDRLPPILVSQEPQWTEVSWRYLVFPYIEEQELYDAMQSPWRLGRTQATDTADPIVLEVLQCPSAPGYPTILRNWTFELSETTYVGVASKCNGAVNKVAWRLGTEGAWYGKAHVFGSMERDQVTEEEVTRPYYTGAKMAWITDGMSQTLLLVENARGMIPGRDQELLERVFFHANEGFHQSALGVDINRYETEQTMWSHHPGGINAALCDGSVRFINEDTARSVVAALASRQDGD
jgi:prepilin-type N-terminal cleavage/methylation domain-containing protein/prepilin-type processing-associated H-X9-DG protein